jgi:Tfp pilus assembly protein PilF
MAGIVLCGLATALAVTLSVAESLGKRDTPADLRRAVAIQTRLGVPSARLLERLASLDPQNAPATLLRAVGANPRLSSAWIALGLAYEAAGKLTAAEHALNHAATNDRRYLPAWTLASFYFRRADKRSFWTWARRAARFSDPDPQPLLQLCDLLDPGHASIRLGSSPGLDRAYLDFLIRNARLDDAQNVAMGMLARHNPADAPTLGGLLDVQLGSGHGKDALSIWNGLARARWIRFPPLSGRDVLTNGDLRSAPSGTGFDWRLPPGGVFSEWRNNTLTFSFEGSACDACPLLEQFVPLDSGRYRLQFEYLTRDMPRPTGIRWRLNSEESQTLEPSDSWRPAEFPFSAATAGVARLRLFYRREPGTTEAAGRLAIRNLRLEVP